MLEQSMGKELKIGDKTKFEGSKDSLIMENAKNAARGLDDFMIIVKTDEWQSKMAVGHQEKAIEDEMRELARDIHRIIRLCTLNGDLTNAFSGHLHYLTMLPGIQDSVKPTEGSDGVQFVVVDVSVLHDTLRKLNAELIENLNYIFFYTTTEKTFMNGVSDKGRESKTLSDFKKDEKAQQAGLR